jgi:thiol-disulfide isomerase/thioredoxin
MRKTQFIIVILLLLRINLLFAMHSKNDSLLYSGTIKSPNGKPLSCKVKFNYNTEDFSGKTEGTSDVYAVTDINGFFKIKLPDLNKPYMILFTVRENTSNKPFFRAQPYFAESGDDIKMNIEIDTTTSDNNKTSPYHATFSGSGADKYTVAWQLTNPFFFEGFWPEFILLYNKSRLVDDQEHKGKQKMRRWKNADEVIEYLELTAKLIQKYTNRKDSLIKSKNLSSQMRKILSLSYGGMESPLSTQWLFRCLTEYNENPELRDDIAKIFQRYDKVFSGRPDDNAMYSYPYLAEEANRIVFELRIKNNTDRVKIKDVHNVIKNKYRGATRDYLWRYIMAVDYTFEKNYLPFDNSVKDSLLVEELNIVTKPLARKLLQMELTTIRKRNSVVYDGEFIMLDGKSLKLSSLRGKVVLIDIWFNGCTGCAKFHEAFNTIYSNFKDNTNFVVLSVNVDNLRERWTTGIESNHYTSMDRRYINVTTGNWFSHPFMKNYNITGASYTMLIDSNGKILPESPNINDLSKEITKALEMKSLVSQPSVR